jgi:hypothetical protein
MSISPATVVIGVARFVPDPDDQYLVHAAYPLVTCL